MLFTKTDQISLAHQRFATGVNVDIGPQFLSLPDHIVQLFEGKVQLVTVLRRPAAGAVEVTGGGGIHQDRPGNVALILVLHFHSGRCTDQRTVDGDGFHQLLPLAIIDICPQTLYQLRPVIVRVCQCSTDSFDLRGNGLTTLIVLLQHIQQLRDICVGVFVQIAIDLLHGKAFQHFRCVHFYKQSFLAWHGFCFFQFSEQPIKAVW